MELFRQLPDNKFSLRHLASASGGASKEGRRETMQIVEQLLATGVIESCPRDKYRLSPAQRPRLEGTVEMLNTGSMFVHVEGMEQQVYIHSRNSLNALDGDRVQLVLTRKARGSNAPEGEITAIVERSRKRYVGTAEVNEHNVFVRIDSRKMPVDVYLHKRDCPNVKNGDKVVVRIAEWAPGSKSPVGELVDILGKAGENDTEMHAILAEYDLPYRFEPEVEAAAEAIDGRITCKDYAERRDFRQTVTFTVDPADAKDFDDALSIRRLGNGLWEVGVHIADVSHYVKEGSIIDKEAQKRATSIYLVDRTIPMLPEHLCNFVCSLRPDEEKLCYSVIFNLDDEATVKSYRIAHTVIRSDRRYAYEEVQQLLEDNGVVDGTGEPAPAPGKDGYKGENAEMLITLDRLAKKLRKARFANGAVKFDREELHFDIDEKGKPVRCYFKRSKDANKLIEEFMLLANRTVAESVGKVRKGVKAKTLPYRVHDNPDPQKLETLREFIVKFGYKLKTEGTKGATARSLNKLMDDCQGKKEQNLIQTVALRAMMKAKYSIHNIGHFGLAFDYYTHFTSPIRRYPDTMVHRLLTRYQNGGRSANREHYEELCKHSSEMEQIAANAERDSIKYKAVEFMSDKIGNVYDAHISGIQSYGIYCEIDENHCEGLVPMRDLNDDYYDFDERNYCLVGRHRHHKYQLGDPIRIKVAAANLEKKQLDFTLAE